MNFFSWRNIVNKLGIITDSQKDLKNVEALNTSGSLNILTANNINNSALEVWKSNLKSFYISKFKYDGDTDKLDVMKLENYLWTWGKLAIIKHDEEVLIGSFSPKSWDYNNKEKEIYFFPIREALKKGKKTPLGVYEVGKDAVVIYCSVDYWLGTKWVYSPFFKVNNLLTQLSIVRNQLLINVKTARSVITTPYGTSEKQLKNIYSSILSGSPVIISGTGDNASISSALTKSELLDFKDRTSELIETHNHLWEECQTTVGIDTNANSNKKERQINSEIKVNNALSKGINKTELLYRERGLKEIEKIFNIKVQVSLEKPEEMEVKDENKQEQESFEWDFNRGQ